jgi:hypothetical protein
MTETIQLAIAMYATLVYCAYVQIKFQNYVFPVKLQMNTIGLYLNLGQ